MSLLETIRERAQGAVSRGARAIDLRRARRRLRASDEISGEERRLLEEISLEVHPGDAMYRPGQAEHYLSVGVSAVRGIEAALGSRGARTGIRSVLDFPCGYGRVLRFLSVAFPEAGITGAEIDAAALDFCRREFGVDTFRSGKDLARLSLHRTFDLIWCGSLLTHLDERGAAAVLRFFCDRLSDRGVCVFTTHGSLSAEWLQDGTYGYGLDEKSRAGLLRDFRAKGYGYADYGEAARGYGISVVSLSRVAGLAREAGDWRRLLSIEHGWDRHQDLHAYTKSPPEDISVDPLRTGPTYLASADLYPWRK